MASIKTGNKTNKNLISYNTPIGMLAKVSSCRGILVEEGINGK
jgi:hypothetical protein